MYATPPSHMMNAGRHTKQYTKSKRSNRYTCPPPPSPVDETKRMTTTKNMNKVVEDSAPVQDRLCFLSCLSFPPRWELRRDLARRYAAMGVLGSAAAEFVDLEMWEEAVECYRQMDQVGCGGVDAAATRVVRVV